ncbi:MAG: hypothetical protein K0M66_10935 [Thiobacillus sp.]|nr:hypothetical protein [Thiobacillus sp.]
MTDPASPWHTLQAKDVLGQLQATPQGFSTPEAQTRLRETGPNRIERGARRPWFRILLHQLADPIVNVLLAAALLAILIGKVADSFVVLAVVVLNTAIGFIQEMRPSQAIEALRRMVPQSATVALARFFVISLEKWVWRLQQAGKTSWDGPIPGTRT